jgi:esterase/lipase
METSDFNLKTADGRNIVVWQNMAEYPSKQSILICGGFSTRMSLLSPIVAYILKNNANVYRVDYLDHVGLSDGEIRNFGFESMSMSIEAALSLMKQREQNRNISILSISLGAVGSLFVAAKNSWIQSIGCLVGVMDVKKTMHRVFENDYYDWEYESLPAYLNFLGHEIDPRTFWTEHSKTRNADISLIKKALSEIKSPVFNLVALEDRWLDIKEVQEAFSAEGGGPREIIEMQYAGHELARNPIALRLSLKHLVSRFFYNGSMESVLEPSFDEIADLKISDRKRSNRAKELV